MPGYKWLFSMLSSNEGLFHGPCGHLGTLINKTAWDAKLILTGGLAYPVSCAGLGYLLMAQQRSLCLSVCFSPRTAPLAPLPLTLLPPTCPTL